MKFPSLVFLSLPAFTWASLGSAVTNANDVEGSDRRLETSELTDFITRAGLVEALSSPAGPFTVFAPNNAAFAALPHKIMDALWTNDEFIPHLRDLLLYHVLSGLFSSNSFSNLSQVTTMNGETSLIELSPFRVNGVSVVEKDYFFANGIFHHVIDKVLFPSWVTNSITDRIVEDIDLSTLRALFVFADFTHTLTTPGTNTLLAPTNLAFAKLAGTDINFLTSIDGEENLVQILLYHFFPGVFVSSELSDGMAFETLQGDFVHIHVGEDGVFFNEAKAVQVDILANNGVVHKIDTSLTCHVDPSYCSK
jgi:transforming growth factor-beta-induced protein